MFLNQLNFVYYSLKRISPKHFLRFLECMIQTLCFKLIFLTVHLTKYWHYYIHFLVMLLLDKMPHRWWHAVILSYFQCCFSRVLEQKRFQQSKNHWLLASVNILQWRSIRETSIIEAPQAMWSFELVSPLLRIFCSDIALGITITLSTYTYYNPPLTLCTTNCWRVVSVGVRPSGGRHL